MFRSLRQPLAGLFSLGLYQISGLTASSIQSMLNSTANSSHFPFFLLSELAMVYSRKALGLYLITRKHKITKLLPSSVGLSAYNIIKLQRTKVDTEANRLSTHQAKVITYTPHPERLARSQTLCETSLSEADLRRGGRYHGVHA